MSSVCGLKSSTFAFTVTLVAISWQASVSVTVFKDTWVQGYANLKLIAYAKTLQTRKYPEIWGMSGRPI